MHFLFSLLFFLSVIPASTEISMLGVKIHDSEKSMTEVKLDQVSKEKNMVKFKTENGNYFSITTEKGKVVYMENDWLQHPKGRGALITDFQFGRTTLKDIRARFGTNGYTYKSNAAFTTNTHLVMFNCFELDSENEEILVTITKIALNEEVTESNVASKLTLDALILADKSYLDKIWGKEKTYDAKGKKVSL
jgi:hypothetical protein